MDIRSCILTRSNGLKLKLLNDRFISYRQLFTFYQLFRLSFWRHPFTAEDPLVNKWCNATFLQIYSDEETNSSTSWIAWGWVHFQQIFIYFFKTFSTGFSYSCDIVVDGFKSMFCSFISTLIYFLSMPDSYKTVKLNKHLVTNIRTHCDVCKNNTINNNNNNNNNNICSNKKSSML